MEYGIIFWCTAWCLLSLLCFLLLVYSKVKRARQFIEHFAFRIIGEISVGSIDEDRVKKEFKKIVREAIREELSNIKLNELDDKSDTKKN